MKLYLIRHGESETNAEGQWTGWYDVSLTEKGFEDAKRARPFLEGISFDKIYSSDLKRAYQTAQTAIPGCEPEKTVLLREINVGSLAGTSLFATPKVTPPLSVQGYRAFGGESREDLANRLLRFLSMLEQENYQTVAAFAHAGCLRTLFDELSGGTIPRSAMLCRNCCIAVFEYNGGKWSLHSWINTQ